MDAPASSSGRWDNLLERAYRERRGALHAVALRVLHDRAEAEDCVQDTVARLLQHGHSYTEARGSIEAFLVVCVRNEALTRVRKRSNRSRIERERLGGERVEPPVDAPVVERAALQQALQTLSVSQRETMRLAYYAGLTHEQIAARTNEPVGTIKSRLSAGLRALRAYYLARGEDV